MKKLVPVIFISLLLGSCEKEIAKIENELAEEVSIYPKKCVRCMK